MTPSGILAPDAPTAIAERDGKVAAKTAPSIFPSLRSMGEYSLAL
jgi:hypothetical protein